MKYTLLIFLSLGLICSCKKEPLSINQPLATITATVLKVSMTDSVGIFIDHPFRLSLTDTSHFSGNIIWGDGNITNFDNVAQSSLHVLHKYINPGTYSININLNKPSAVGAFTFHFKGLGQLDTLLSLTGLGGVVNLWALVLQNDKLSELDISSNTKITNMFLRGNRLSQSSINNILVALDNEIIPSSVIPYIQINQQQPLSPPSGIGIIAKQNLINKGWSVETD